VKAVLRFVLATVGEAFGVGVGVGVGVARGVAEGVGAPPVAVATGVEPPPPPPHAASIESSASRAAILRDINVLLRNARRGRPIDKRSNVRCREAGPRPNEYAAEKSAVYVRFPRGSRDVRRAARTPCLPAFYQGFCAIDRLRKGSLFVP
jgi:hypothetical protein